MNKVLSIMTMSLLSLIPLSAFAHGAAALRFEKSITIKAPPAKVWPLVKDFANEQVWHAGVDSVSTESKKDENGANTTYRTVKLKTGGTMYEKLRSIDNEGMRIKYEYIYEKSSLQVANFYPYIAVSAGASANESIVTVKGSYTRADSSNIPKPEQNDEAATKALESFFGTGLESLKKVVESGK